MTTDREVSQVVLNKLTKAQYDAIETKNPNEFYAITDADLDGKQIIGSIIQVACSSSYIPNGCLPCDGSEYTRAQFPDLYDNFLVGGMLNTSTYTGYASDITTYGQCGKFALDTTNQKFKVPKIKDGSYITQAMSNSELGKAYNESLPKPELIMRTDSSSSTDADLDAIYGNDGYTASTPTNTSGTDEYTHRTYTTGSTAYMDIYGTTYQSGAKVQGDNIRMRFFVVVANGTINDSDMDWSAWATGLASKANSDLSNINPTSTAKQTIIGWGIPDYSSSIAISSGYVAPSNGYVYIVRGGGSSAVTLYVKGVAVDSNYSNATNEGGGLSAFVAKGSTITWTTGNISSSVFFPCIGG